MTQYQSALTTLIGEVLADPDLAHSDVFRRMLQAGLQDLVDAESTAKIGAARYERTSERTTRRNGTRPKVLATPAGEVDLAIPKLREGSFFPSLLHPRRRVDKALYAVICQAWIDGVSTRKVEHLVRALGNDTGINSAAENAAEAKFGIVGLGWQLSMRDADWRHLEQFEVSFAKEIKAIKAENKTHCRRAKARSAASSTES